MVTDRNQRWKEASRGHHGQIHAPKPFSKGAHYHLHLDVCEPQSHVTVMEMSSENFIAGWFLSLSEYLHEHSQTKVVATALGTNGSGAVIP